MDIVPDPIQFVATAGAVQIVRYGRAAIRTTIMKARGRPVQGKREYFGHLHDIKDLTRPVASESDDPATDRGRCADSGFAYGQGAGAPVGTGGADPPS